MGNVIDARRLLEEAHPKCRWRRRAFRFRQLSPWEDCPWIVTDSDQNLGDGWDLAQQTTRFRSQ